MRPRWRHWLAAIVLAVALHAAAGLLWSPSLPGGSAGRGEGSLLRLHLSLGGPAERASPEPESTPPGALAAPAAAAEKFEPESSSERAAVADAPRPDPSDAAPTERTEQHAAVTTNRNPSPPAAVSSAPPTGDSGPGSGAAQSTGRSNESGPGLGAAGHGSGEDYLARVVARVNAVLRYPPRAHRRGVNGVVLIAVRVGRDGALESSEISVRSGSPVLDRDALSTVRRAAPFDEPPEAYSESELEFDLPIEYALEATN